MGGNDNNYIGLLTCNRVLPGGTGNDTVIGGDSANRFVFAAAGAANGTDRIFDFIRGTDQLVSLGIAYSISPNHALTAAEFTTGTAAVGTSAHFIWNPTSHFR